MSISRSHPFGYQIGVSTKGVENIIQEDIYPAACCDRHQQDNNPSSEWKRKSVFEHEMAGFEKEREKRLVQFLLSLYLILSYVESSNSTGNI